jgi:uncharacterized membrane protein YgcG
VSTSSLSSISFIRGETNKKGNKVLLIIILILILTLDLKLIRHRRLFAAFVVLINSVEDASSSRSSTEPSEASSATGSDGRETGHGRSEIATVVTA